MNTFVLLIFAGLVTASTEVSGNSESNCPSGLPVELLLDCTVADQAARNDDSSRGDFGGDYYNVTEKLQAWVDRQMQLDIQREGGGTPESDVAQQLDEH